jgi:hypothetical protein
MVGRLLRGSTTVVELGSSLGVTSGPYRGTDGSGGHMVCVEANLRLLPGLCGRLAHLVGSLRVDFVHAAVTGHSGDSVISLSPRR